MLAWPAWTAAAVALAVSTFGAALPAVADDASTSPVAVAQIDGIGPALVDTSGRTLYVFRRDSPDASVCTGGCASTWPPLFVSGDPVAPADLPGVLGAIDRPDGTRQATYDHAPLYTYAADGQPGDAQGQSVGGVWFVAVPEATDSTAATDPSAPPAATTPDAASAYHDQRSAGDGGY